MAKKKTNLPVERFLITGAQKGAPVDQTLLSNMNAYASVLKAKIVIVPIKGLDKNDQLAPSLLTGQYEVIAGDRVINKRLSIKDMNNSATLSNPLAGLGPIVQVRNSAIIGATKQYMLPKANSQQDLPKILMSTGTVTLPTYPDTTTAKKARDQHAMGFIVVEANAEFFQYRLVRANTDGTFVDLCHKFENKKSSKVRAEALVLGDLHTGSTDADVLRKTLEIIKFAQPKFLILHDLFDGQSVNHHEMENLITRSITFNRDDLFTELKACGLMIELLQNAGPSDMKIIIVKSNHDEFLTRYLQAGKFSKDPRNLWIASELVSRCCKPVSNPFPANPKPEDLLTCPVKPVVKDVLEEGITLAHKKFNNVIFLRRGQDFKVLGWQLGAHGDKGPNGAKNFSYEAISESTGLSITGHKHTPGIFRNAYVVGTSTRLDLSYTAGSPSSWMHTHALLYPNRKAQLLNIINGDIKL